MIVGDSISEEFAEAFLEAFDDVGAKCNPDSLYRIFNIPCVNASPFQLQYIRNDRLSIVTMDNYNNKTHLRHTIDMYAACLQSLVEFNIYECEWINRIDYLNASLIIMNRGAHFMPTKTVLTELNQTLQYLQQHFPNVSIIYRNTPHGHEGVSKTFLDPPLLKPPVPYGQYNYPEFYQQNIEVFAFLKYHFPQILYLDVFTSTVLRVDSHRDALHYCFPGPIATWMQTLFYNAIKIVFEVAHSD
jgi:hypothetical protein